MYYSFFDTAVNTYLIEQAELDIHNGNTIGLVVRSSCDYFAPVSFPDKLVVGISVTKIGDSSVSYQVAVFDADDSSVQGDDNGAKAVAQGKFVHVYVDAETRKPTAISDKMRASLEKLLVEEG